MDKAKKKQTKKIVTWVLLAALVAGLAAMPLMAQKEAEADGPVASILSGKVEEGSIQTTLRGGGNLEVEDTENIRIPSGVKITEFLVRNGDRVTEGTPLAAVDKVSVMTAITSVTDTMEYLQKEMRTAKNEKVAGTITATAGGRVKKVYAQKGDNVQRVMLEHGALALLSLDGLMAVKIERKMDLPTGQSVEVILSDKKEVTGRVDSNLNGEIVITVEDKGYAIGEKVTVVTNDGDRVGTGELYVHNAWTVTAYSGTIQTAPAKEETKVTSGTTLFTLTDTDFRGDLEYLAALHREYEVLMQELFNMYNSGTINAPCTGMVSGVDKDSAHLLSGMDGEWQITLLNHTEEEGFVAFGAQVISAADTGLNLAIDPALISLDNLHNLAELAVDSAAMTEKRTYSADTTIYRQTATGALVATDNTPNSGDRLLFVGDESGVLWVVNLEQSVKTLAAEKTGVKLELLSGSGTEITEPCTNSQECKAKENHVDDCPKKCKKASSTTDECLADYHEADCIKSCISADNVDECKATKHYADCIQGCTSAGRTGDSCTSKKHKLTCIESCNPMLGESCTAQGDHHLTCIKACTKAKDTVTNPCPAKPNHYAECIESCIVSKTGEACPAVTHKEMCFFSGMEYTAQIAKVTAVGSEQLVVKWDSTGSYDVVKTASGWVRKDGQKVDTALLITDGPTISVSNPKRYQVGDVIFLVTGKRGETTWTDVVVYQRSSAGGAGGMGGFGNMTGMGGMSGLTGMGGMTGMDGGTGMTSNSLVDASKLFDINGSVLLTVTPETTVSLTINLDERDIAEAYIGQKATVKIQALAKETFEAEVVEISNHGENNGGHSKFAVKLRFAKTHDMIDGMSATAILELEHHETVLMIPVAALEEHGSKTIVYTALDEKTGQPSNPVEVTIGASDGENVQILEGLELGDTYYYSYYDTVEINTAA